jgi:hypothetical protein
MIYLANASSAAVRAVMGRDPRIGQMCTPNEGRAPLDDVAVAFDNGCFGPEYVGDLAWMAWLARHAIHGRRALFATAPDVVGDAAATLVRSAPHLPAIRALGYSAAFVGQNGLVIADTPWDSFDVLFLGGMAECLPCGYVKPATVEERKRTTCPRCAWPLTEWKLSLAAAQLVAEALRRNKRVHMGRVNSYERLTYCVRLGVHSADGTYLAFGPDKNIRRLVRFLDAIPYLIPEASA